MQIEKIHARQILDSRGYPTVEADVILADGTIGRAAVPSGASTGRNEALEMRDEDPRAYLGKGVLKAVENVNVEIASLLSGMDVLNQVEIDEKMIDLDGTENKSKLGANSILAVSLASAKAAALASRMPLYRYFNSLTTGKTAMSLPRPMMNIINGGAHANFATDIQEFMIFPLKVYTNQTFSQDLKMGVEVFQHLKKLLEKEGYPTTVGDEGGFVPKVSSNSEPLDLITRAAEMAGYRMNTDLAFTLDVAASELFEDGHYRLKSDNKLLDSKEMVDWIAALTEKYPIVSVEDGLSEDDWDGWVELTKRLGDKVQIVGDDLLVTNIKFLEKAITKKAANAILVKVNQIGTLTETIKAVEMARNAKFNAIISHRSGETEDTTIAHLAVGLGVGQIKTGSLSRTDRVAKYNELVRIEEELAQI